MSIGLYKIFNIRNFLALALLGMPVLGVFLTINAIIEGPNYFSERYITIKDIYTTPSIVTTRKMGGETKEYKNKTTLVYTYFDSKERMHEAKMIVHDGDLPHPIRYYEQGNIILYYIPVDQSEGRFALNSKAKIFLTLAGLFFFLTAPILLVLYFEHVNLVDRFKNLILLLPLFFSITVLVISVI